MIPFAADREYHGPMTVQGFPFKAILSLTAAVVLSGGLAACGSKPVKKPPVVAAKAATEIVKTAPVPEASPEAETPKASPEAETPKASPEAAVALAEESAPAPRLSTEGEKWMIAAAHPLAAEAGRRMLRDGGAAVDAAIAAQMVLNLVEPQSSGIGGGGFMMHLKAETGEIAAYDGREKAPAGAGPDMFLNGDGKPKKFFEAAVGGLSVGVPGLLRMLEMAHEEHGRLPWAKLFQPAIELARRGFAVSPRLNGLLARDRHLKTLPVGSAYFYDSGGAPRAVGETLANGPLADSLESVATGGADAFYEGPLAESIVAAVNGAAVNPGSLSLQDMAAYRAVRRDPSCLFYRVWLVCGMGPPSSGGLTTLQILGILQSFDLASMKPGGDGVMDLKALHLIAEASKLAFADRNTYIADPDFVPVPAAGMLDPGYLALRAEELPPRRAHGDAAPGMPGLDGAWNYSPAGDDVGLSTTHISVVDGEGNAVSMTSSIENAFGSRLMVGGFLLNNQLTDFSFVPERDGGPVVNAAEPLKRPRSSMAPTLVIDGEGKPILVIGSPGGSRIIGYVAQAIIAALDWDMDIQDALDMPHMTNRNGATELEAETDLTRLEPLLEQLGHVVKLKTMTSGLHAIRVRGGKLFGGADPRREGVALAD